TKRCIALEQIDFAIANGVRAGGVMADAWYYSEDFVKELKLRGLKYFLGMRTTIKISIKREKRISIAEYLETLMEKDFTKHEFKNGTYFLHSKEVSIRGDGKETLLISYKKGDEKNIKCYVTNYHKWKTFKYMKTLLKRWSIECLHRDTKQHLGLEKYQVRKYRGMQAVALAILAAYTLLILNKSPTLLKKFRPLQTIGEMCRFTKLCTQKTTYWLKKTFKNHNTGRKILNQYILVKNAKV
ncbi:MAG: transposase, partial [Nanoarchaeota archaeon]|nr:transposase [Nanoarchaeota archaeon]